MSGYNGFSMSNNAVAAYESGLVPASKAAKLLNVSTDAIKAVLLASEWHHTSSHYNKTNFYDISDLMAVSIGQTVRYDSEELNDLRETIDLLVAYDREQVRGEKRYLADVKWLTWSGTRKHPTATEHTLAGVEVIERGKFYYFYDGKSQVKKQIGSNGTHVIKINN